VSARRSPAPLPARHPSLHHVGLRLTPDGAVLDLSDVSWFDPALLAGAAALCHESSARGPALRVVAPRLPGVARYAARLRLGVLLDRLGVPHDFPQVREQPLADQLLELTMVDDAAKVRRLAGLVRQSVVEQDRALADALFDCLGELGENVEEHSGTVGFAVAQTFPTQGFVRFAVADAGAGLLGTLHDRGAGTDEEATRLALSGTSRRTEGLGGWGLPHVLDLVTRLGGYVFVATGRASVVATSRAVRAVATAPFPGTVLEGSIPVLGHPPGGIRGCRSRDS
jgi:hypothetical protein